MEVIHTLPNPDELVLAELAHEHAESEADELAWREHMAKLKFYAAR